MMNGRKWETPVERWSRRAGDSRVRGTVGSGRRRLAAGAAWWTPTWLPAGAAPDRWLVQHPDGRCRNDDHQGRRCVHARALAEVKTDCGAGRTNGDAVVAAAVFRAEREQWEYDVMPERHRNPTCRCAPGPRPHDAGCYWPDAFGSPAGGWGANSDLAETLLVVSRQATARFAPWQREEAAAGLLPQLLVLARRAGFRVTERELAADAISLAADEAGAGFLPSGMPRRWREGLARTNVALAEAAGVGLDPASPEAWDLVGSRPGMMGRREWAAMAALANDVPVDTEADLPVGAASTEDEVLAKVASERLLARLAEGLNLDSVAVWMAVRLEGRPLKDVAAARGVSAAAVSQMVKRVQAGLLARATELGGEAALLAS